MTDTENKDQSKQENADSSDSGQQAGNAPPPTTSQDFEFTDSSFKRGQDTGSVQKRIIDNSQESTVTKEKDS
jgi:hypothetical protein